MSGNAEIRVLPEIGFLTTKDLVRDPKHPERLTIFPFGRTTLWEKVKHGDFPPPDVRLGAAMVAWKVSTIRAEVERICAQQSNTSAVLASKRARSAARKKKEAA